MKSIVTIVAASLLAGAFAVSADAAAKKQGTAQLQAQCQAQATADSSNTKRGAASPRSRMIDNGHARRITNGSDANLQTTAAWQGSCRPTDPP